MARPRHSALSPADLDRIGRALFGPDWRPPLAEALRVSLDSVRSWAIGRRGVPPSIRAELARLLRQAETEVTELAEALEGSVGLYHGLTRRELALIGWALDSVPLVEGEDWLSAYASPAQALRNRVRSRMDGAQLADGEAERLFAALGRLDDAKAVEVWQAARDVHDLTTHVPDD